MDTYRTYDKSVLTIAHFFIWKFDVKHNSINKAQRPTVEASLRTMVPRVSIVGRPESRRVETKEVSYSRKGKTHEVKG